MHLSWFHRYGAHINPLPLKPGSEDYFFLDQAVEDIKHGLEFILRYSIDTPKLDASFDEADVMPCSVS